MIDRNAAAVVDDGDRAVDVNRDVDLIAEARQRLVDRVVDDFVDEVVQAGRTGRADVHRRPLADGLEAFEHLDLVGGIVVDLGGGSWPLCPARRVGDRVIGERLFGLVCLLSSIELCPRCLSIPCSVRSDGLAPAVAATAASA